MTNVVALVAIPLCSRLAARVGRKPVLVVGAVGSGALMFAYLAAIAIATARETAHAPLRVIDGLGERASAPAVAAPREPARERVGSR